MLSKIPIERSFKVGLASTDNRYLSVSPSFGSIFTHPPAFTLYFSTVDKTSISTVPPAASIRTVSGFATIIGSFPICSIAKVSVKRLPPTPPDTSNVARRAVNNSLNSEVSNNFEFSASSCTVIQSTKVSPRHLYSISGLKVIYITSRVSSFGEKTTFSGENIIDILSPAFWTTSRYKVFIFSPSPEKIFTREERTNVSRFCKGLITNSFSETFNLHHTLSSNGDISAPQG